MRTEIIGIETAIKQDSREYRNGKEMIRILQFFVYIRDFIIRPNKMKKRNVSEDEYVGYETFPASHQAGIFKDDKDRKEFLEKNA
ncbi:MAG: hypothetical protein AB1638_02820 [Nitrospirota bacterium]